MFYFLYVKSEIDCEPFTSLQRLKEVRFNTCRKLLHVDRLLDCPSLVSVELTDCNDPLKQEGKRRFKSHPFEQLDIDYA